MPAASTPQPDHLLRSNRRSPRGRPGPTGSPPGRFLRDRLPFRPAWALPLLLALSQASCLVFQDPPPVVDDQIPPGRIEDLAASTLSSTEVELTWTAVGDDEMTGSAAAYQLRQALVHPPDTFTEVLFDSGAAEVRPPPPEPAPALQPERHRVQGLPPDTQVCFRIRALDDAGLLGPARLVTATPRDDTPPAPAYGLTLADGRDGRILLS